MSNKTQIFSTKKRRTYLRMLKSIIVAAVIIVVVLTVLQLLGINVSSMLAGIGIVGIVVGLALQDAMKDVFRGLEIIADSYYDIGDVISFGDNVGQVKSINLRTTKLQDINTMNTVSIANRNIDKVEVLNGYIYLQVPLPYELKVKDAEVVMQEIVKNLTELELTNSATYQGVTNLGTSALVYQVVITCEPINQLQARRDALRTIVTTMESHKLQVPYTQIDVHDKK
ncbi:mechanosensitive ion channel family protein [Candidatus Saccharibacteria bacterium]|nr:mechanosensitive ion channel family protein [Candidatus Saccharibacteria bacterium]